jgi:enoyl-CoA hydratase/carnithine racemase
VTSQEYETLLFERRDKAACVTLNRPERLNAVNHQMIAELDDAYRRIEEDPGIWCYIVTGAGDRALCSGADVSVIPDSARPGQDTRGESLLASYWQWDAPQEATPPYLRMTKPMICAVNGLAAGAGLDLITTCDIAIAAEEATFFDPHVSIGVVSGREAVRLARVLPLNVAMRVALMGSRERLTARRAYELGLVSELVPRESLRERAWEIAATLNTNAPLAVRGTRLAIRKGLGLPVYEAEVLAESHRLRVAATEDAAEGARAFLEKRGPEWKAR